MMQKFEEVIQQRAYDGKWQRLRKIKDYENEYSYTTDAGYKVKNVPDKWITVAVYDQQVPL